MPVSAELVQEITGFARKGSPFEQMDLGEVANSKGEPIKVVFGNFLYQQMLRDESGERLLSGRWTTQPTVALVTKEGAYPLPYTTAVRRLPDRLVEQVAGVVSAARNRKP